MLNFDKLNSVIDVSGQYIRKCIALSKDAGTKEYFKSLVS